MAVYYGNSSTNSNYRGRLEFSETTNVSANTSTISWTFKLYRQDGYSSSYNRNTGNNCTLTVDGSSVYSSTSFSVVMANATSESSAYQIASGSFTVTHNADGAKSFSFSAKYWNTNSDSIGGSSSPLTVSGTHTCITIPRASSVTATSVNMGSNSTITITKASSSFTHTLTYSLGSASGTIATKTTAASVTWAVPISLASQIPNAKTGTCTITCQTYNGNTLVGTKTTTCTLTVPSSTAPTLTVSTAAVDGFNNRYLQNKSKCKLTFSATGQYSATIRSYTITGIGTVNSPYTTGVLGSSGNVYYTVNTTDSRGYTASKTVGISVDAYANPSLSGVSVFRCNSSGTAADSGTYISAKATANYSSVSGTNSATLKYQYRVKGGSWSSATAMTSGTAVVFGGGNISITSSYEVLLTVTDAVGNSAQTIITVPTSTVMLDFRPEMNGAGIGAYAELANRLMVNPNWTATFGFFEGLWRPEVIGTNDSIYAHVRAMGSNELACFSVQNATDNPRGTGLVCDVLAYSPASNGNYTVCLAYSGGSLYVSDQLSPSATSITWNRYSATQWYPTASANVACQTTWFDTGISFTAPVTAWYSFHAYGVYNSSEPLGIALVLKGSNTAWRNTISITNDSELNNTHAQLSATATCALAAGQVVQVFAKYKSAATNQIVLQTLGTST